MPHASEIEPSGSTDKAQLHVEADADSLRIYRMDPHQHRNDVRFHLIVSTPTVEIIVCIPDSDAEAVGVQLMTTGLEIADDLRPGRPRALGKTATESRLHQVDDATGELEGGWPLRPPGERY